MRERIIIHPNEIQVEKEYLILNSGHMGRKKERVAEIIFLPVTILDSDKIT